MSEPSPAALPPTAKELLFAQAEYVQKLTKKLAPWVQAMMRDITPPQRSLSSMAAGFIQAFTELELSVCIACAVNPFELVRSLRMVADDIERSLLAELAKQEGAKKEAPKPSVEFKVDF
jgi:hypothetical protein